MAIFHSFRNLTKFERILWLASITVITLSFLLSGDFQALTLIASLIGVTALIFVAKGDVLGQILTVVFSIVYAVISWELRYYGEMITYLGMTMPMAMLSVVSWLKNPFEEKKNEVKIAPLSRLRAVIMVLGAAVSTVGFYFILKYFHNASLVISTISITTSFLASYLTFCRSAFYALAYAANDVVLIILWVLAAAESLSYLPMVICVAMFFLNDLYGFYNWRKMYSRQQNRAAS